MEEPTFIQIGYLKKPHGLGGHLKIVIDNAYLPDFDYLDTFFISLRGSYVPHFLEELNPGNHVIIKFEGVDSREAADLISSNAIFAREDHLQIDEADRIDPDALHYAGLVDFELHDETLGILGNIKSIEDFPQQEMAVLDYKGKEIFIPLNDTLILTIDPATKVIKMDLPEGLLNL